MPMTAALPCVLLVEDDPVSRAFLAVAIEAMPALVETADSIATACGLAAGVRHDAWLIDANLPDGRGEVLLARLRARYPGVPAIAHTADNDPGSTVALRAAGFDEVLVKPLPAAAVQRALHAALAGTEPGQMPAAAQETDDWDDALAARALNGSREHVAALRALFLAELPAVHRRVTEALQAGDADVLGTELHRLRASCGFVGAVRLQRALQRLAERQDRASAREFSAAVRALAGEIADMAGTGTTNA